MTLDEPVEKSQSQRLTEEHRRHARSIEVLRGEFAPSTSVDREYQDHQRRVQEILGPTESGIVDGKSRMY